jgi:hypothetical protein
MFQQVPIIINHNWEHTKALARRLFELKEHGDASDFGNSTHYDFAHLGTLSDHKLSKNWYRVAGPAISKTMPWLPELLDTMKELNPDDGAISYLNGDGAEHTDVPSNASALNYVIDSTDDTAYTWVKIGNNVFTYPSDKSSAWILNTQIPHGISNAGIRWTLSIHFDCEYNQLSDWFESRGQLIFGDKE